MALTNFKGLAIRLSAAAGTQYLLSPPRETSLTTLLYHRFFFANETKDKGRERLKRQLDWLRREYTPLTLTEAAYALSSNVSSNFPLLVTVDDASTDLLDVYQIFKSFEIPIAVFVCVGWTSQATDIDPDSLLSRVVAAIEWYRGPDITISLSKSSLLQISQANRAESIDELLGIKNLDPSALSELTAKLQETGMPTGSRTCNWHELADIRDENVEFGCHSVSHIRLAGASLLRMAFEMQESKRIIERKFGESSVFAYPYGVEGTFSKETAAEVKRTGFDFAFLTFPGFANRQTDPLHLPRIALPDSDMSTAEFRARVKGGGIALGKAKQLLARH